MSATPAWLVLAAAATVALAGCKDEAPRNVEHFDGLLQIRPGNPNLFRHVGDLVDGERHGRWLIYSSRDGKLDAIQHWRHGVRHGPTFLYRDNELSSDLYYWNGKRHGRWRTFDEGQLIWLGWYEDDKREGIWCSFWEGERLDMLQVYQGHRENRRLREYWPQHPCPHTEGAAGRRHFDPTDRNYGFPRGRPGPVTRRF